MEGIKEFKKKSRQPIRKSDWSWPKSDSEKATTFGEHPEQVFTPLFNINHNGSEIENFLQIPCQMSLHIKPFSRREVVQEIENINPHKLPYHRKNTQLPRKAIALLTTIYNSMLRMSYYSIMWKLDQIIMIPKPEKPAKEINFSWPISLLSVTSKLFEKLLLKRIRNELVNCYSRLPIWIQGRTLHNTTNEYIRKQDHNKPRRRNIVFRSFPWCTQAFDKFWHTGLLCKIKNAFPSLYYLLL
jgi:hypothetical protein